MKSAPGIAFRELESVVKSNLKGVKVLSPFPEKAIIQSLQEKGLMVFDKDFSSLNPYQKGQKKDLITLFTEVFNSIKL